MIQGYQLNMAVFFFYLEKVTCPVYTCTVTYTGQVTLYKAQERHDHVSLVTLYVCVVHQRAYLNRLPWEFWCIVSLHTLFQCLIVYSHR